MTKRSLLASRQRWLGEAGVVVVVVVVVVSVVGVGGVVCLLVRALVDE
jgi:hypothetical protein